MTVQSSLSRADYLGNGVSTGFLVPFRFLANTHLQVLRTVIATNVTTVLVLGSLGPDGFSVTGAGQPSGGTVTVITPPASGERLSIIRNMPFTQLIDYIANDAFPAESHERGLDERTMENQQMLEVVNRAITLPPQTTGVSTNLPAPEALKLLRWNAAQTALENATPPAIATVADGAVVDATVSPIAAIQGTKLAFVQEGAGSVTRTVQDKQREVVSPMDKGAVGDGVADDTAAVQAALNVGRNVYIPEGKTFVVVSVTASVAGQRIYGRGTLKAKANVDGQVLRILANDVIVDGVRFDCTAPKPTLNQANDAIRLESVNGCSVINCKIDSPKGGGVAVLNSARNRIIGNLVLNTHDNGILIANLGADHNVVSGNTVIGTTSQNCIFLTADSSSLPTADFIFGNVVSNNVCRDAIDTGIEVGQHCTDTTVTGNDVRNCANPEILLRDCHGVTVVGNVVHCDVGGNANHDGIAILEQNEANWEYNAVIADNVITGRILRGGIYMQGANAVSIRNNKVKETVAVVNGSTGAGLTGGGVITAGTCSGIDIVGNDLYRLEFGVFLNIGGGAVSMTDCTVQDNKVRQARVGLSMVNVTFTRARVTGNTINSPVNFGVSNSGAMGTNTSRYDNNVINLSGFGGAAPVAIQSPDWNSGQWVENGGNDTGWTAVTFQNGWANLAGYDTAAFRKVDGRVMLKGVISAGTAADTTVIFNLPAAFRPIARKAFKVVNANNPTSDPRVEILANGDAQVLGTVSNTYLGLDGISFSVD